MSLQWLIVAMVVAASAVFSTWRLLAARHRLALLDRVGSIFPWVRERLRLYERLRAGAQAQLSHGCGACTSRTPAVRGRRQSLD